MVDLGALGGWHSLPVAINRRGEVAGWSITAGGALRAFLWTPADGMVDLGTLGGRYSRPVAINALGQIVGWSANASGRVQASLSTAPDGMKDLGTLGGETAQPVAINGRGQVAGTSTTAAGQSHAVLWDPAAEEARLGATAPLGGAPGAHLRRRPPRLPQVPRADEAVRHGG